MRVSLEWLKEYVDITLSPEQLERRLTLSTVEIEGVERSHDWNNVWVGRVLDVELMPDSDHLRLASVDLGATQYRVVCGAPNVAAGQKIAYAGIGAKLIDGHTGEARTLKAAKIRGHESSGMICSERELGLSHEHDGILELPADAPVGEPLAEYLGDVVLIAGAWAHRADLLSMLGFAREVAALTGQSARTPDLDYPTTAGTITGALTVEIADPDLCHRYVAGLIEGVTIGPSPKWMQQRLTAAGQRPINNVVDITNYVMLEFGQPLHAFDYDRVRDHRIIVRRARDGERLTTLDGIDRPLNPEMLVIADPAGPIALAGVMGGMESEVGAGTTNILLEAANFHATNVRRTSTLLSLRSEASSRFEKQLPANLAERAARRAMQLLVAHAGGKARAGFVDSYPVPQKTVRIELTTERLRKVLGIDVSTADVTGALRSLGFECEWRPPNLYEVTVPDWRTDVLIPDDVVEEVIRIIGFERLPSTTIAGRVPEHLSQPRRALRDRVKDILVAAGAQEVITYSVVSDELLKKTEPAEDLAILQPLRVVNPVSAEHELMRTSMRGSMLETVAGNLKLKYPSLSLFEAAVVYIPAERREDLPEEREMLVGALTGKHFDRWGRASSDPLDFFDAKGYLECLDDGLRAGFSFAPGDDPILLSGRAAQVQFNGKTIGVVGQVHPDVLARFDIDEDVFLYELSLTELLPVIDVVPQFSSISRFPAVDQDIALLVDRAVSAGDLVQTIRRSKLVLSAEVFDDYTGDRIPAGKRSLAIAVRYQSADKTLTDADVAREQERILRGLKHQFGAELRG